MRETRESTRERSGESGFALLLAILSLMLLTFLGLTLAATTSTELQIATNYRWSLQAFYNAEAGIEAGKRVLQTINWRAALPPSRGSWAPPTTTPVPTSNQPVPPFAGATRNFEMGLCDQRGFGAGYGVVLNDGITAYENISVGAAHGRRARPQRVVHAVGAARRRARHRRRRAVHRQHGRRAARAHVRGRGSVPQPGGQRLHPAERGAADRRGRTSAGRTGRATAPAAAAS